MRTDADLSVYMYSKQRCGVVFISRKQVVFFVQVDLDVDWGQLQDCNLP